MATYDNEQQEQLEQFKHFWKQYGNLITWVLILALGAFAAWNGWNWWQRDQSAKAGAMFEELDRAVLAGDADKAGRVFNDLKERFPRTAFAQQGGLAAARLQFDKGQADAAKATLTWVATQASEPEYRSIARLRLAGLLLDAKQYDEALKQLDEAQASGFFRLEELGAEDDALERRRPDGSAHHREDPRREGEPERRLVETDADLRVVLGDRLVAAKRDDAAAGDRVTVDPRDGRCRIQIKRLDQTIERGEDGAHPRAIERGDLLQVEPGRERVAGSGDQQRFAVRARDACDQRLHRGERESVLAGGVDAELHERNCTLSPGRAPGECAASRSREPR